MIAGLDAYPPDFLLGILVEVAATVPRARLESRRAEKRAWKT